MNLLEVNSPVKFDQRNGIGATSWNQEVDYRGIRVYMKCSNFLRLIGDQKIEHFDPGGESIGFMRQQYQQGMSIGSPFLDIDLPGGWFKNKEDLNQAAQVKGFEGRKRVTAILNEYGDKYIEVHFFFNSEVRRRHITPVMIKDMMQRLIPLKEKMPIARRWFLFKD